MVLLNLLHPNVHKQSKFWLIFFPPLICRFECRQAVDVWWPHNHRNKFTLDKPASLSSLCFSLCPPPEQFRRRRRRVLQLCIRRMSQLQDAVRQGPEAKVGWHLRTWTLLLLHVQKRSLPTLLSHRYASRLNSRWNLSYVYFCSSIRIWILDVKKIPSQPQKLHTISRLLGMNEWNCTLFFLRDKNVWGYMCFEEMRTRFISWESNTAKSPRVRAFRLRNTSSRPQVADVKLHHHII